MIISDNPNHKIDIEFISQKDGDTWLQITVFHLKGEWVTKVIRLGPVAIVRLHAAITEQMREKGMD